MFETDFVIVLLSKASCESEWVKKEVNIALTKEIYGKKVVVLPCLIEDCNMPLFLTDKKYADFRDSTKYIQYRKELISTMGLTEKSNDNLFLDQHIFYDLNDLNDGFDVEAIRYFSKSDFEKVLERVKIFNIMIFGIEPWPNKEFYNVTVYEESGKEANDSGWYYAAFENFVREGIEDYFSASYGVPEELISIFNKQDS